MLNAHVTLREKKTKITFLIIWGKGRLLNTFS